MTHRPPTAVFKSLDNGAIEEYEALTSRLWDEFQVRAKAKASELRRELAFRKSYEGIIVNGYVDTMEAAVPEGWRRDATTGIIMPHQRSKLGKQIAADLYSISYRPPSKPGLPDLVWGDGFMGVFNLSKLGGDWYAYITVPLGDKTPESTRLSEVDPALWEPCKMSTYYTALEDAGVDE